MSEGRISIRLDPELQSRIEEIAEEFGRSESSIIREALERYVAEHPRESAYDAFVRLGLIGCVQSAPRDLSTNKRHFKGLGRA